MTAPLLAPLAVHHHAAEPTSSARSPRLPATPALPFTNVAEAQAEAPVTKPQARRVRSYRPVDGSARTARQIATLNCTSYLRARDAYLNAAIPAADATERDARFHAALVAFAHSAAVYFAGAEAAKLPARP